MFLTHRNQICEKTGSEATEKAYSTKTKGSWGEGHRDHAVLSQGHRDSLAGPVLPSQEGRREETIKGEVISHHPHGKREKKILNISGHGKLGRVLQDTKQTEKKRKKQAKKNKKHL